VPRDRPLGCVGKIQASHLAWIEKTRHNIGGFRLHVGIEHQVGLYDKIVASSNSCTQTLLRELTSHNFIVWAYISRDVEGAGGCWLVSSALETRT
jgi:hypothetical protein